MTFFIKASQTEPSDSQGYTQKGAEVLNSHLRIKASVNSVRFRWLEMAPPERRDIQRSWLVQEQNWVKLILTTKLLSLQHLSQDELNLLCMIPLKTHLSQCTIYFLYYNNETDTTWGVFIPSITREQGKESWDFKKRLKNCCLKIHISDSPLSLTRSAFRSTLFEANPVI